MFEVAVKGVCRYVFYSLLNSSLWLSCWFFENTKGYYLREELGFIKKECELLSSDMTVLDSSPFIFVESKD